MLHMLTVGGAQAFPESLGEVQAAEKRAHGPQVPMCMSEPEMCLSGGEVFRSCSQARSPLAFPNKVVLAYSDAPSLK